MQNDIDMQQFHDWFIKRVSKTICMAKSTWLKERQQNTYFPGLSSKPSLFVKIKLKWPISRGSHFKIHVFLEYRRNRGTTQNFHGIHFFKDRVLINPNHKRTKIILTHFFFIFYHEKIYETWMTKCKYEYQTKAYQKYDLKRYFCSFRFFPFFL